jgi:plastocyanin
LRVRIRFVVTALPASRIVLEEGSLTRKVMLGIATGVVLVLGIGAILALKTGSTSADEGGVYLQFGLPGESGAERDRNTQGILRVAAGTPVVFWNRSGWAHQVAVYDKDLAKNGSAVGTTLLDITVPTSGTAINDAVGRLALGPSAADFGCGGPAFCAPLTKGVIDFTYTFKTAGTYLVICNVLPHFVNYAHATFVIVE